MRVEPLVPDAPQPGRTSSTGDTAAFSDAVDAFSALLDDANHAEDAFAAGNGSLQDAVYERARADVAISVLSATAQHAHRRFNRFSTCKCSVRLAGTVLARWSALPRQARVAAATGLALAIVASLVIEIVSHPVRIQPFATPLHPEQVAEVEERLADWHIAFAPSSDNVAVDAARRNDILLKLSLAGVPHPHLESSGEALSNVGVLTPQAVIDAQTRSGLAGDIEAGLRDIDGIDDARSSSRRRNSQISRTKRLTMLPPACGYICVLARSYPATSLRGSGPMSPRVSWGSIRRASRCSTISALH